jgi:hypothetical protein
MYGPLQRRQSFLDRRNPVVYYPHNVILELLARHLGGRYRTGRADFPHPAGFSRVRAHQGSDPVDCLGR